MSAFFQEIRKFLAGAKFRIRFLGLKFVSVLEMIKLKVFKPPVGTRNWMVLRELEYGGYVVNMPRNVVSRKDPRTKEQILWGGWEGGDRMSKLHHGYAEIYAEYLRPFVQRRKSVVLAEIGVLMGTGVAIWSELFPDGRILGLDIDLSHIRQNIDNLKRKGAFINDNLELYEFDQFEDNQNLLKRILANDKIDICIDDGVHCDKAVLSTIKSVTPSLAKDFVYFIEDNSTVHKTIRRLYSGFKVENFGKITVLSPK